MGIAQNPLPKRDEIIKLIQGLPESSRLDDIVHYLYVREQILLGHQDAIEGHSYTNEEAQVRLKKWLS